MHISKEEDSSQGPRISRRGFLGGGACLALLGASGLFLPKRALSRSREVWKLPSNGSRDPYPIPWLDRNGSHNQSPGPGMEPSSIYHFKGQIARANNFTGMGTDNKGNRIAFGAPSTDFSFMRGEYFAARAPQVNTFTHI
jgi:hypothetical protein